MILSEAIGLVRIREDTLDVYGFQKYEPLTWTGFVAEFACINSRILVQ